MIGKTSRPSDGRRIHSRWLAVLPIAFLLCLWSAAAAFATPTTSTTLILQGDAKIQVGELQAQADAVQAEIDRLDEELAIQIESYNELNIRLEQTNQDLAGLRRSYHDSEDLHQRRQARLDKRLADTYKSGSTGASNLLALLLATDDFAQFVNRVLLITKLSTQDRDLVDVVRESVVETAALGVQVEDKKRELLAVRRELDRAQIRIEEMLAQRQDKLDGLDSRIATLIEQERQRQEAERLRLEAELRSRLATWQRYDGPIPQTDDAVLNQLVETAATYLGIPYVWGGKKPRTGFDCSGLVKYVLAQHGVDLPHFSGHQAQMGVPVALADIRPGDVVAFGTPVHHIGMYVGDGLFIHAPRTGDVVKLQPLSTRRDINTIRRFPVVQRTGPVAID
ncbi:MAG: C40 family peptidase [Actinobacteria bacterium]|nr:C40 family peptidase [Actinomycetota bacterium]